MKAAQSEIEYILSHEYDALKAQNAELTGLLREVLGIVKIAGFAHRQEIVDRARAALAAAVQE